jgi:hypothetical protein
VAENYRVREKATGYRNLATGFRLQVGRKNVSGFWLEKKNQTVVRSHGE